MTQVDLKPTRNRTLIFTGLIGNTMEWYDFAVYGYYDGP